MTADIFIAGLAALTLVAGLIYVMTGRDDRASSSERQGRDHRFSPKSHGHRHG